MTVLPFATQIKNACAAIEADSPFEGEVIFCVQGVASPLLANLFLHYAFDLWVTRHLPGVRFARYADDAVLHCKSRRQADYVLDCIRERFRACKLELHPGKTRIV
jgi:RNA-directed DNA polymerase